MTTSSPAFGNPLVHIPKSNRRSREFLAEIRIDHGPAPQLSQFFVAVDAALARQGISLEFATFDELLSVNRANRDSWRPLNPTFRPESGLVTEDSSFVLLGRNPDGHIVTAIAMKVFEWQTSNFKEQAESLQLLYADPGKMAPAGAICCVTCPSAKLITGRAGYAGAAWWHPSVRGRNLGASLSRALRAYAYARWKLDVAFGISSTGLIAKGYVSANGYKHTELGVSFNQPDVGPPEAGLAWITADELLDDIDAFLSDLAVERGGLDQLRRAQQ